MEKDTCINYLIIIGAFFCVNCTENSRRLVSEMPHQPTALSIHACMLTNEEVSGRPHLPVFGDDIDHQGIAHQPDQHDEGKEEGHEPGVSKEGVLISIVLTADCTSSLGDVRLGAVHQQLLGGVPELPRRVHGATARWVIEQRRETQNAEGGQRRVRSEEEWVIVILCAEFPCKPFPC